MKPMKPGSSLRKWKVWLNLLEFCCQIFPGGIVARTYLLPSLILLLCFKSTFIKKMSIYKSCLASEPNMASQFRNLLRVVKCQMSVLIYRMRINYIAQSLVLSSGLTFPLIKKVTPRDLLYLEICLLDTFENLLNEWRISRYIHRSRS